MKQNLCCVVLRCVALLCCVMLCCVVMCCVVLKYHLLVPMKMSFTILNISRQRTSTDFLGCKVRVSNNNNTTKSKQFNFGVCTATMWP